MENIYLQKNKYMNVHSNIIHNSQKWKQPKCPSMDEWINKMWYIHTMECYLAIKRNEIQLFVMKWMNIESVIQSEVSQQIGRAHV